MYVININMKRPPSGPQKPLTFNELGAFFMPLAESIAKRVFVAYFISFYFHLPNNIESIDLA
jgi:hypothetical protein